MDKTKEEGDKKSLKFLLLRNGILVPESRTRALKEAREELNVITGMHHKKKLD